MNRVVKPLLVVVLGLFLVMTAVSVFMPSQVMTSKWVQVANHQDSVIKVLSDLHSWPEWNGLLKGANNVSVSDRSIEWPGSTGKKNTIRLEAVTAKGISTPISIAEEPFMKSGFSVEKRSADSVQVVWFLIEDLKWYPWEKFYGMMAADMKGPLMQESLDKFKNYIQTKK